MDKLSRIVFHGWFVPAVGVVVFAGALIALWVPVYLGSYDKWGIEIQCGNGYSSHPLQAAAGDRSQGHDPGSAASYVEQCNDAVGHRRVWLFPIAGVGAGIVTAELLAWVRRRDSEESAAGRWRERPDTALHDAAVLDRRFGSHEPPPHPHHTTP